MLDFDEIGICDSGLHAGLLFVAARQEPTEKVKAVVRWRKPRAAGRKPLVAAADRKTAKAFFEVYDREYKGAITWDTFLEIDQAVIKFLSERD